MIDGNKTFAFIKEIAADKNEHTHKIENMILPILEIHKTRI